MEIIKYLCLEDEGWPGEIYLSVQQKSKKSFLEDIRLILGEEV